MSGKKGSEVASVLKMGETARKDTDKKYDIKINDLEKKMQSTYENAQSLEHTILEKKIQGTKEAQQMFASQLRQEEERLAAIKKQAVVKFKAKDIKGRLAEVKSKLVSADNKAADIRARIAYKHDYCDNEYREATAVKNTYSACRADYENIYNTAVQNLNGATAELNRLNKLNSEAQQIAEQIEKMNIIAKEKQESDSFRQKISDTVAGIDKKIAKKFLAAEYSDIEKSAQRFYAMTDKEVLNSFSQYYEKVTAFVGSLNAKYAQWQQEKADAEGLKQQVLEMTAEQFEDPYECALGNEDSEQLPLFQFLKKYVETDFETKYNAGMNKIEKLLAEEKFVEAKQVLSEAQNTVIEANSFAANLSERIKAKSGLALELYNIMSDMGYDVGDEIIDGNPDKGFRITCQAGDEIIDFNNVNIDEDGRVIVDIDHTEAVGGTCKNTWPKIVKNLREAGIPVTDITKNGNSILYAQQVQGANTNQQQRAKLN